MRIKQHPNTEKDYQRANNLRHNATPQEQKLWLALRGEAKKKGIKFRRQQALHPYIVDFACLNARLVIEVDGYSHDLARNNDKIREQKINQMGYMVLRFMNEDIDENLAAVICVILSHAEKRAGIANQGPHPPHGLQTIHWIVCGRPMRPAREGRGSHNWTDL